MSSVSSLCIVAVPPPPISGFLFCITSAFSIGSVPEFPPSVASCFEYSLHCLSVLYSLSLTPCIAADPRPKMASYFNCICPFSLYCRRVSPLIWLLVLHGICVFFSVLSPIAPPLLLWLFILIGFCCNVVDSPPSMASWFVWSLYYYPYCRRVFPPLWLLFRCPAFL